VVRNQREDLVFAGFFVLLGELASGLDWFFFAARGRWEDRVRKPRAGVWSGAWKGSLGVSRDGKDADGVPAVSSGLAVVARWRERMKRCRTVCMHVSPA